MSPVHSVIMPVINGAAHIAAGLASAFEQLGSGDEVIIVDNGSTDDTIALVKAIGDPRIRLLHAPIRGVAAARNVGLDAVRGEYVSFLDHDDLWPEGRVAGLLAALASKPTAKAALGRFRVFFDVPAQPLYQRLDGVINDKLSLCPFLFRAAALRQVGHFDETLAMGEDTDFLVRLAAANLPVVHWDGDAYLYRRHQTNMTIDRQGAGDGMLLTLARHLARRRGPQ